MLCVYRDREMIWWECAKLEMKFDAKNARFISSMCYGEWMNEWIDNNAIRLAIISVWTMLLLF